MILVFLLLGLILIMSLIVFLLLLSSIKIKILRLYISNVSKKFELLFVSKIGIYLFNKCRIFEIRIDDNKIKNLYKKGKLDIRKLRDNNRININAIKLIKNNIEVNFENLKLVGGIGLENAMHTAYAVFFINAFVPIIISNKKNIYQKNKFIVNVNPIFSNQNLVNLEFNCIISIKVVHIINIVLSLLKKGRVSVNERTSNRRAYAYSNE